MHTKSTFARPTTRSVGFTVSPRLKHVCVQSSIKLEQHAHPLESGPHHKVSTCSFFFLHSFYVNAKEPEQWGKFVGFGLHSYFVQNSALALVVKL